MKVYKLFIITVVCCSIILSFQTPIHADEVTSVENKDEDNHEIGQDKLLVGENSNFQLYFDEVTAEVVVFDKYQESYWYSNSPSRDEDQLAKGIDRMDLNSQLTVNYTDANNRPFYLNNFTGSINDNNFTWEKIDNGIEVIFSFEQTNFSIPVRYSLESDHFKAEVLADKVITDNKYKIVNIHLLPFFGAGSIDDDGYLFIPDGSGALIHFNNGKQIYPNYNQRIYGRDPALDTATQLPKNKNIKLPVFGIKKNDDAFLAVIHQGEYQSGITAKVSRKGNEYNSVNSYLNFIESETSLLMEGSINEKEVLRTSKQSSNFPSFEVRYYFLYDDSANYVGMANRYREYLMTEKDLSSETKESGTNIPLHLDLLGAIKKADTFFGVPYTAVEALSTYEDAINITNELIENKIDQISLRFNGWMKNGMKDKIPTKVSYERKLGGKKSFQRMTDHFEENNVDFYPAADFVNLHKSGNGFYSFFNTVRNVNRAPAMRYDYRLSTKTKNPNVKPSYLLKYDATSKAIQSFTESMDDNNFDRLAINGMGNMIYSNFDKNGYSRNTVGDEWDSILKNTSEKIDRLMFDNADAYALPYAEKVINAPLQSSQYDVMDESIPFYSIVLRGNISLFSEPINLSSNPDTIVLKLLETGTFPAYSFIGQDRSRLINTEFNSNYSPDFSAWKDNIVSTYETANDVLGQVVGEAIINHEILQDDVRQTTYENGLVVTVNYSHEDVEINGNTIDANSYLLSRR